MLHALRNGTETETAGEFSAEVNRAREAWREALLERGIISFLRDALADFSTTPAPDRAASLRGRIPHLGYSRPGLSNAEDETEPEARPSFTSPDFVSPDFGGPEHDPE
ncbi:hypothetical protein [Streptomyces sp. bgisy034]|uniref:hypothetical protein n=1 Tax=Streptomyces sp. bgisy034 TaxID=3413774 RepID=UPI003EBDD627